MPRSSRCCRRSCSRSRSTSRRSGSRRSPRSGGHFFGAAHTLERYETAFYRPILSDWRNYETWHDDGARTATERANGIWKQLLAEFEPPPMGAAAAEAVADFVARRKREIGGSR